MVRQWKGLAPIGRGREGTDPIGPAREKTDPIGRGRKRPDHILKLELPRGRPDIEIFLDQVFLTDAPLVYAPSQLALSAIIHAGQLVFKKNKK